ncbi:MAG: hypothetical protein JNN27_18445 [Planctomycetes bacterium]|nr:hypothetical protein [Planctomycetota bacterium]
MQLVDSDDAIVVPEDLEGRRRSLAWLTVALFLALCVGTLAIDLAWPAPLVKPIGAEAVREAELERRAKFSDGSLAQLTERRLRRRSRVRLSAGSPYALALYRWLNFTRGDAFAGKDGWLFHHSRTGAGHSRVDVEKRVRLGASMVAGLSLRLAALGSQLTMMPIPRKELTCVDRIPTTIDANTWADPYLLEVLGELRVRHVDLTKAWTAAQPTQELYCRAGSHWTAEAQRIAAEDVARAIGKRVDPQLRRTRIELAEPSTPDIDMLVMAGVEVDVARAFATPGENDNYEVRWIKSGKPAFLLNPVKRAEVAIVGTSFTAKLIFGRLLAHAIDGQVSLVSAGGSECFTQFAQLLERRENKPPPHVILEGPAAHMLFMPFPPSSFDVLPVKLGAPAHVPLLPFGFKRDAQGQLALELSAARININALEKDALFQDGAGWAHARLRGVPGPDGVQVTLVTSDTQRTYEWPAGLNELFLPVPALATRPQNVIVGFSARGGGAGSLVLQAADLVALGNPPLHRFAPTARSNAVELSALPAKVTAQRVGLVLRVHQPAKDVGATTATLSITSNSDLVLKRDLVLREGVTTVLLDASELLGRDQLNFRLECADRPIGLQDGMLLGLGQP